MRLGNDRWLVALGLVALRLVALGAAWILALAGCSVEDLDLATCSVNPSICTTDGSAGSGSGSAGSANDAGHASDAGNASDVGNQGGTDRSGGAEPDANGNGAPTTGNSRR